LWNVKRIRPRALEPVDYTRENWTRSLWFAEGVTSTYESFTRVRSGMWTPQQFYNDLGGEITALQRRPARLWKSAEEASLDAWLEKYASYRRPEYSISYYNKGQLLGVLLDILIRDATDNRRSLDDVMRDLNERFAHPGKFYDEQVDLRAAVERAAGRSFEEFFRRYVSGTDELPYREVLALAGLLLTVQGQARAELGFSLRPAESSATAIEVQRGSAAELAGLRSGDLVLSVNGEAPPRNVQRWLRDRRAGESVTLRLRRGAEEKEISFSLGQREDQSFSVEENPSASEKQKRIRAGIVQGVSR
jgi:predicted metalloprotease with PDZ domain